MDQRQTRRNDNLKMIAMITMLIDHMGHMHLVPEGWYRLSRTIGRIAFPIFAYQIAIGFEKTSNRKRYAWRLLVFGLISQVPYVWFNPELEARWLHFNIMFLLLAGLGVLRLCENAEMAWQDFRDSQSGLNLIRFLAWGTATFLAVAAPETITILCLQRGTEISFEYSGYGLLMILFFRWFRKHPAKMAVSYLVLSAVGVLLTTVLVAVKYGPQITGGEIGYFQALSDGELMKMILFQNGVHRTMQGVWFQARGMLTIPVILMVERTRGRIQIHLPRVVGYWFYPVHIAILTLIAWRMTV